MLISYSPNIDKANNIRMIENNVNHFIEIGPGKVLSGLVKRISRDVKIDTINSISDINSIKV